MLLARKSCTCLQVLLYLWSKYSVHIATSYFPASFDSWSCYTYSYFLDQGISFRYPGQDFLGLCTNHSCYTVHLISTLTVCFMFSVEQIFSVLYPFTNFYFAYSYFLDLDISFPYPGQDILGLCTNHSCYIVDLKLLLLHPNLCFLLSRMSLVSSSFQPICLIIVYHFLLFSFLLNCQGSRSVLSRAVMVSA